MFDKNEQEAMAAKQENLFSAVQETEKKQEPAADVSYKEELPSSQVSSKIEDFGEKIGGAKKDYWQKLTDAKNLDIATHPLSEVWPEPDYKKMIEDGTDPFIVGFVRAARDEVPTKPQKAWKVKQYVEEVTLLRDGLAARLLSGEISKEKILETLKDQKWYGVRGVKGRAELYEALGHDISFKGITFQDHH